MRVWMLALLAGMWLVAPLWAEETPVPSSGTPLDATNAEIVKFYGPILRANARVHKHLILEGTALDGDLHGKNGLVIRVVYHKDRSVLLEYTRITGQLTLADVNPLLTSNAGGSAWQEGKDSTTTSKFYRRQDDKAIAHWTADNDGSLLVSVEDGNAGFGKNLMQ